MSHPIIKTACVVAGFAVAALSATTAHAGQPLTMKQKNDLAAAMASSYQANSQIVPKTVAEAEAGLTVSGGVVSLDIPEELHNYLTASPDAKGNMHVRDTDATGSSTAAAVEVSNEK